jgi:hypothetical protein
MRRKPESVILEYVDQSISLHFLQPSIVTQTPMTSTIDLTIPEQPVPNHSVQFKLVPGNADKIICKTLPILKLLPSNDHKSIYLRQFCDELLR